MDLSFINNIAEVEVSGDFNIHLEREEAGDVQIYLKTAGTEFADTFALTNTTPTIDCDFTGYVYPKTIKIKSLSKVLKGYVTENA